VTIAPEVAAKKVIQRLNMKKFLGRHIIVRAGIFLKNTYIQDTFNYLTSLLLSSIYFFLITHELQPFS
jgi:hypothetical protein